MSIYKREPFADFLARVLDLHSVHVEPDNLQETLRAGRGNDEETVAAIGNAPDAAVLARKKLLSIHKDFPYGAPLAEQAAFLVRGFTGLAPLGEADHATGWDYTAGLLEHNGHTVEATAAEVEELGLQLFDRLDGSHPQGFGRGNLLDRDDLFSWLTDWFHHRIA